MRGVRLQQDKEAIERRLRELEGPLVLGWAVGGVGGWVGGGRWGILVVVSLWACRGSFSGFNVHGPRRLALGGLSGGGRLFSSANYIVPSLGRAVLGACEFF